MILVNGEPCAPQPGDGARLFAAAEALAKAKGEPMLKALLERLDRALERTKEEEGETVAPLWLDTFVETTEPCPWYGGSGTETHVYGPGWVAASVAAAASGALARALYNPREMD